MLSHGNYRTVLNMLEGVDVVHDGEVVYLFLPLAHAFALLIQLLVFDVGSTMAYFGGDTQQIVAEVGEVKPTYLPSVPRIFEKIYTLATASLSPEDKAQLDKAVALGVKVRDLQAHGQEVPEELKAPFAEAEKRVFANVRAIFGGNLRQAVSGAAPIAPEILEFFYAAGVPVLEGYGMTETATVATYSTVENHRFGTVGRALPGSEIKIADDGEVLIKGPNIFGGYYRNDDASFGAVIEGWLHTGDLGEMDADGYLKIVGPQEGHHHHRRGQEPHAGQHRERPQAVALDLPGGHARRPPALPGRAHHARRGRDRAVRAGARPGERHRRPQPRTPTCSSSSRPRSTAPTRATRRSSRSRSSSSSTTTSLRRPGS